MDEEQNTNKPFDFKPVIGLAALLVGGAVFYYFAIFLPGQSKAKLDFEKQQYQDQQKAKQDAIDAANAQKLSNQTGLNLCLTDADNAYWNYMKLNGTVKADGTVVAATRFWDAAAVDKKEAEDVCFKKYPQN